MRRSLSSAPLLMRVSRAIIHHHHHNNNNNTALLPSHKEGSRKIQRFRSSTECSRTPRKDACIKTRGPALPPNNHLHGDGLGGEPSFRKKTVDLGPPTTGDESTQLAGNGQTKWSWTLSERPRRQVWTHSTKHIQYFNTASSMPYNQRPPTNHACDTPNTPTNYIHRANANSTQCQLAQHAQHRVFSRRGQKSSF